MYAFVSIDLREDKIMCHRINTILFGWNRSGPGEELSSSKWCCPCLLWSLFYRWFIDGNRETVVLFFNWHKGIYFLPTGICYQYDDIFMIGRRQDSVKGELFVWKNRRLRTAVDYLINFTLSIYFFVYYISIYWWWWWEYYSILNLTGSIEERSLLLDDSTANRYPSLTVSQPAGLLLVIGFIELFLNCRE